MADASDNTSLFMSKQMHLSLTDLSMELKSLGMKTFAISNCQSFSELCEALLSSTWTLVSLVHGRAMGFTEDHQNVSEGEAILRSEKQSLESKVANFKSEIDNKSKIISKEQENVRQLERKLKTISHELQQEKHQNSLLVSKLEAQARDFRHEILRQEAEMEQLRNIIRKSLGLCQRQHSVPVDRLGGALESLSITKGASEEVAELQQSTLNRLKSVNHTLVGENLIIRDALEKLHSNINSVLADLDTEVAVHPSCSLPENIFHFPLSYIMNKLCAIRQEQLYHLHAILKNKCNSEVQARK